MFIFSNRITECFCGADELIWLIIFNEPKVSRDHQFLNSSAAAPIKECNLWLCQEIWPPMLFRSLLETRNWKWKGVTKKKRETEGGCPRLAHAVQRFVLYVMNAHGNLSQWLCVRLSILYHRETHYSCFSITHTLTRRFCSWEKNYDPPGLLAASSDYFHFQCCVWCA